MDLVQLKKRRGALSRRGFLASLFALAATSGAQAAFHGSISGGGGAPTFDTTMTVRPTERNWLDVSTAVLNNVPTGNKVTVTLGTLSGSADGFAFTPWQYPSQGRGAGNAYAYATREIGKWTTIDTTSSPTGAGKAWVTYNYLNGSGETGSIVTYTVGLNVSATGYTTWNYGAKSAARHGGVLLSKIGTGTATSITSIVDKNSIARTPFEVFYGRMVLKATDGTSTTYGSTRSVDYATCLAQTPYTVTFNNGDVLTVNMVDSQWDVAPAPDPAVITAMGDNSVQHVAISYVGQFALGDKLMYEDGLHNPTNRLITIRFNHLHTGLNAGTLPTRPTAGTWNVMNLEQPANWVTHTSRTPWGAQTQGTPWSFGTPAVDGTANTYDAGVACMRWCNLQPLDGITASAATAFDSNSLGALSWIQVDHCYQDVTAQLTRQGGASSSASFFYTPSTSVTGGVGYVYIHDNWCKGNTIAITAMGYDIEVIGNRIDACSEDAIRHGAINLSPGSNAAKVWFNFIVGKWWGNSSHPDYIQDMRLGSEFQNPKLDAAYPTGPDPTIPATFGSTLEYGTMIGNMGCPDSDNNWNWGENVGGTTGVKYQLDDGEGWLGSASDARFHTHVVAGRVYVTSMTNAFYVQNASSGSRFSNNTDVFDLYADSLVQGGMRTWLGSNGAPFPGWHEYSNAGGKASNNFSSGATTALWANCAAAGAVAPTQSNNSTTAYASIAAASAVLNDPGHNWSTVTRMQELLDALGTKGAEASRGAQYDKTIINHRQRTFNAGTLLA